MFYLTCVLKEVLWTFTIYDLVLYMISGDQNELK